MRAKLDILILVAIAAVGSLFFTLHGRDTASVVRSGRATLEGAGLGMTEQEIRDVKGPPTQIFNRPDGESWLYQRGLPPAGPISTLTIHFRGGRASQLMGSGTALEIRDDSGQEKVHVGSGEEVDLAARLGPPDRLKPQGLSSDEPWFIYDSYDMSVRTRKHRLSVVTLGTSRK